MTTKSTKCRHSSPGAPVILVSFLCSVVQGCLCSDGDKPSCQKESQACQTGDCCSGLVCGSYGLCADAAGCLEDPAQDPAGSISQPASLKQLADDTTVLHGCPGPAFLDVFEVKASAGEQLQISMSILDEDPQETGNLDMYLYDSQGSFVQCPDSFEKHLGCQLQAATSTTATETISHTATNAQNLLLTVTGFQQGEADYRLQLQRRQSCQQDEDCDGEHTYCAVSIDEDTQSLYRQCLDWQQPSCGQDTAEDSADSHSESTAADFASLATGNAFTASICSDDVDTFSLQVTPGTSLIGTISAPDLAENSFFVAALGNPSGKIVTEYLLYHAMGQLNGEQQVQLFYLNDPGRYVLHLLYRAMDGSALPAMDYQLNLRSAPPCRLDLDCTAPLVCSLTELFTGPKSVCSDYKADQCGQGDDDNSFSSSTLLTAGSAIADQAVCQKNPDYYKITLDQDRTNLAVQLSWTGAEDLDLYMYLGDGTYVGAGVYGSGQENIVAQNLAAGDYHFVVDLFGYDTADRTGTDNIGYSLLATTAVDTGCSSDSDCTTGGTFSGDVSGQQVSDPSSLLHCDSTGICVRPVTAAVYSRPGGGPCFDSRDCATPWCLSGICTTPCVEGGQQRCDEVFGDDNLAICLTGVFEADVCVPLCHPTDNTYLWQDADCQRVFGGDSTCDSGSHLCSVP